LPRPRKGRRVCCLPENNEFGTINNHYSSEKVVYMTVEEYECVRLIDYEGMMQEECADRMNVARTTVQRIYNDARKKIADVLVNGYILKIEGGNYELCEHNTQGFGCHRCRKRKNLCEQSE
jgi:predicted DNA-binding protein (UPF0251 family)